MINATPFCNELTNGIQCFCLLPNKQPLGYFKLFEKQQLWWCLLLVHCGNFSVSFTNLFNSLFDCRIIVSNHIFQKKSDSSNNFSKQEGHLIRECWCVLTEVVYHGSTNTFKTFCK